MRFVKYHGIGNDFVIVDARGIERDWPALARAVCHRNFGVGADGLIIALPSDQAPVRMRIFNPDGSEPEMCGNGIRCFAKYAYDNGLVERLEIAVETAAGIKRIAVHARGAEAESFTVGMGVPR
ncbi:MAG: diaminopimelate epimerase, partial [Dehalococcoidia bacterium]|nr:diaminopimelate epimerase [Dehalococcoidia bacterium]